jgi:hypothetical protein
LSPIEQWAYDLMYDQANKAYGLTIENVQCNIKYSEYDIIR